MRIDAYVKSFTFWTFVYRTKRLLTSLHIELLFSSIHYSNKWLSRWYIKKLNCIDRVWISFSLYQTNFNSYIILKYCNVYNICSKIICILPFFFLYLDHKQGDDNESESSLDHTRGTSSSVGWQQDSFQCLAQRWIHLYEWQSLV